MAKSDPNKPTSLSKPAKSLDAHGGRTLRPMSGPTRARRLGKIASANQYSAQHKFATKTQSVVSKEPGIVRQQNRQVLGNFHKGGKVKKSGLYNLKKGETVKRASSKRA